MVMMMNRCALFGLIVSFYLLLFPFGRAHASGCDTCLQAKIESASSSISSALSTLNTTAQNAVTATDTANNTISTASSSYISALEAQQSQLLSSLDAASKKIEFGIESTTTTLTNLTDVLTGTINTNAKNQVKLLEFFDNNEWLGDDSHPLSAAIALNRAEALANALSEYNGRIQDQMTIFSEWAYLVEQGDETYTSRTQTAQDTLEEYITYLPLLATGLLSEDEVSKLLTALLIVVLPTPEDYESLDVERKLEYNAFVEKKAAAYRVLVKEVLKKAPLLATDGWDDGYTQIESEDGYTSIEEFMESESTRKLLSSTWYDDIASLNNTGLLREQVHQTNMQNYLLNELVEAQKDNVLLLSFGGDYE
jgi:hypothetical protein